MKSFNFKYKSIMSLVVACCIGLTACSIDEELFDQGVEKIKSAVSGTEETIETEESEVVEEPTVETESSETIETIIAETTILPTATPTPSPTPMPERVDFSELTEDNVTEGFDIELESFSESHRGESSRDLAVFSGRRMLVSLPENENVQTAINLMLNGFYSEAEGLYDRCSSQADSEYALSRTVSSTYDVSVDYIYSYNDRLLSIGMMYEVVAKTGNETESLRYSSEYITFDIYTGQVVTIDTVSKDSAAFRAALSTYLNNSIALDAEEGEETEPKTFSDLWIMVQTPGADSITCQLFGSCDGEVYSVLLDMNDFSSYLSRYGLNVYGIEVEPEVDFGTPETEETEETEA